MRTQRVRQQRPHRCGEPEQRTYAARVWHDRAQQEALPLRAQRAWHPLLGDSPPDVDEPSVAHARGAGALAGAAGVTAIEVQLRAATHGFALEELLDQINAAAGTVELV